MNVLLVHAKFPITYWGFQYGLPIAGKQASLPPLGLISLAALLPPAWRLRLVDQNVTPLTSHDLAWADAVLVGGMRVQADAMHRILARARAAGVRTVVGGPAPTTAPHEWDDADVVFCGEAECRIDDLVAAIHGDDRVVLSPVEARPTLSEVPVPRFDLLDADRYASMSIQYSRGCPYNCEFCDIVEIFGRTPRVKAPAQVIAELDALYASGYRGTVFFVDDNFIGHKKAVRQLLAELVPWQQTHGHPFTFYTEASVNLAADAALMASMRAAGFQAVFLGIESPQAESLAGAGKKQNLKVDLAEVVDTLTRNGLEVYGGFIVGFDEDGDGVFEAQRAFLDAAPIPMAMIGMLTALPGTALARRLGREGRLRAVSSGDQFGRPNFDPAMDEHALVAGYRALLRRVYDPEDYYRRCRAYVDRAPRSIRKTPPTWRELTVLVRAAWSIGVRSPRRRPFWRLMAHTARTAPHHIAWVVGHAIMGEHLIRYTEDDVTPRLDRALAGIDRAAPTAAPALARA